jgi:hypothetical protein
VEARIKIGKGPHIVGMVRVVSIESPIGQYYVQATLLKSLCQWRVKSYAEVQLPPVRQYAKERRVTQITPRIPVIYEPPSFMRHLRSVCIRIFKWCCATPHFQRTSAFSPKEAIDALEGISIHLPHSNDIR